MARALLKLLAASVASTVCWYGVGTWASRIPVA
jgi:hypothetical protein